MQKICICVSTVQRKETRASRSERAQKNKGNKRTRTYTYTHTSERSETKKKTPHLQAREDDCLFRPEEKSTHQILLNTALAPPCCMFPYCSSTPQAHTDERKQRVRDFCTTATIPLFLIRLSVKETKTKKQNKKRHTPPPPQQHQPANHKGLTYGTFIFSVPFSKKAQHTHTPARRPHGVLSEHYHNCHLFVPWPGSTECT